ncbi:hypothetical protein ABPG72_022242 [Tetrahymena utriculariae]
MSVKKIARDLIFSGIQPSGKLHLGNYLGAIQNWVKLQEKYHEKSDIFFCIVDQHALTDKFKIDHQIHFEDTTRDSTIIMAAALLASGIDPKKSNIFVQSAVPYHAELQWMLGCIAPQNWLNTMTQYKDKKSKNSSLGLYSYPVLMAADILLYNATHVPVGSDQKQHLELTRDYATRFNTLFKNDKTQGISMPQYIESEFPRVMSLKDGTKKMSKSDPSDYSRINLTDTPEVVYDKIKKAKTDSIPIVKLDPNRPEVSNLLRIYSSLSGQSIKEIETNFSSSSMKDFKDKLSDLIITKVCPIGLRIEDLLSNQEYIQESLKQGNEIAYNRAKENIQRIKKDMGMYVM